jgi:hypothetical protein
MTEHRRDPSADAMAHAADPARPANRGDATVAHDVADEAHHDEHGSDPLGPIDTVGWAVGLIGVLLGLAVALCFVFATGGIG